MRNDPTGARPESRRLAGLDALRGVAALAVVFHHLWLIGLVAPASSWQWRLLRYSPLSIILEGRQPVILFFILSGFVLAHALLPGGTSYRDFMVRRFARIYLPFAAAILLSALAYAALAPGPERPFSAWFAGLWRTGHDLPTILTHLLMPGTRRDDLDPVVWSLVHELRISAILPVLVWAARRRLGTLVAASLAMQFAALPFCIDAGTGEPCRDWLGCRPFWGGGPIGSLLVSGYFVVFFVLGIALARQRDRLGRLVRRLPTWGSLLLLCVSIALLCRSGPASDLVYALGAAGLIALTLETAWLPATLSLPPLPWLGRISYSLYLVHVPVFLAVIHGLGPQWGAGLIPILLAFALLAAWLFHRLIEAPARILGRILTPPSLGGGRAAMSDRMKAWL